MARVCRTQAQPSEDSSVEGFRASGGGLKMNRTLETTESPPVASAFMYRSTCHTVAAKTNVHPSTCSGGISDKRARLSDPGACQPAASPPRPWLRPGRIWL